MERLHDWRVSTAQALDLQMRLAAKVYRVSEVTTTRFIAGVDISVNKLQWVVTGAVGYRLPGPARLAHLGGGRWS